MNSKIYRQVDSRWGKLPYKNKSSVGGSGCGLCAVLHCIIERDKYKNYTPKDIYSYMRQFAVDGQGTLWSGIPTALKHYGLTGVKELGTMPELWAEMKKGGRVAVLLMKKGKCKSGRVWTTTAHFVTALDYKYQNKKHYLYFKDSSNRKNDGWIAYETDFINHVKTMWVGTIPTESSKTEPKKTESTDKKSYTGKYPTATVSSKQGTKTNIKRWQQFLNWWGNYKLVKDGDFGAKTKVATVAFQKKYGLVPDGIVGTKTIAKAKSVGKINTTPSKPTTDTKPTVVTKKSYTGKYPEIHIKRTAQEVANNAAEWAKKIATMNDFHYGEGGSSKKDFGKSVYNITHSGGCYFCGTNKTAKVNKIKALKKSSLVPSHWYKTYVCNPFVYSAWVHGGLVTNMNCKKNANLSIFKSSSTFKNLGHPSYSSLKKGDVLLKYVNGTFKHAAIYVGDGKYSEATSYTGKYGNTASKSSIRTKALTKSHYKVFNVVCRYNKSINADICLKFGEYSSRVGDWQDYLNWWSDGKFYKECGGRDNFFGDNTKAWTIKFQEKELGKGEGDGLVGNKTIAKAKLIER